MSNILNFSNISLYLEVQNRALVFQVAIVRLEKQRKLELDLGEGKGKVEEGDGEGKEE